MSCRLSENGVKKMFKAFIVDDEPLARNELAYLLTKNKQVQIVGEAESVDEAGEKLQHAAADVLFLDMLLANESGLDLMKKLIRLPDPPEVVFATAYDDYAVKAFDLNVSDYLLKPFEEERVQQTVDKMEVLLKRKNRRPNEKKPVSSHKLAIAVDERIILLSLPDILYIGTVEGQTVVVTRDNKYAVNDTLVALEKKLQQQSTIIRVHRAYLVNLDAVEEIRPWFRSTYNLVLKNGEKVPVSRTYAKELKQWFEF